MDSIYTLIHLGGFAFYLSLALSGFMISARLIDRPDHRSSHEGAIPTAGGIGLVAGLGAGLFALGQFYPDFANHEMLLRAGTMGILIAALGLADDIFDMSAKGKFAVLLLLCAAAAQIIGPPKVLPVLGTDIQLPMIAGLIGAGLWLFVITNCVNFMDGANGMLAGVMFMAFFGLALVAAMAGANSAAVLAGLMAASLAGFMPYNVRRPALIFAGDVGALFSGFMFGLCGLLLVWGGGNYNLVYTAPLLILPFLVDVLMTLIVRGRAGENLLSAHNSHLYQRLIRAGKSHLYVSGLCTLAAAAMAVLAAASVYIPALQSLWFLFLITVLWIFVYVAAGRKLPN